ncbi:DUF1045 domain-containing protein [Roseivivax marinus]|uniref:DUF1045 domain-containing protein n=1 Tax=Roseivivax marinus TaxID=1379903 RepID=UPI00274021AD|nr:DUF1045 domain-containing protein [Roseivivax marinus]
MPDHNRYAVYYAPEPAPWADAATSLLGWDAAAGVDVAHPDVPGLPLSAAELTARPRKYGLHGTLKPPFRLAPDTSIEALDADLARLASRLSPVRMGPLQVTRLGGFLALCPDGDAAPLQELAAALVSDLDGHRAPPDTAELEKRRGAGLSERQEALLAEWGYPYVMEQFRFHVTLTGPVPRPQRDATEAALRAWLSPLLPEAFEIRTVCLFGEAADGRFHLLKRHPLGG